MCPNQYSDALAPATTAVPPRSSGPVTPVIELDEARARRRRDRLIATRRVLAETAAHQRSHGLEEAEETYSLQLIVEDTIRSEFPQTYWANFADWVEAEAQAEHPGGQLTPGCPICRAIAAATGINLMPPEAA